MQRFRVSAEEAGQRLDQFLKTKVPGISRRQILSWIDDKRVCVEGRPSQKGARLPEGAWVEADVPVVHEDREGVLPEESGSLRVLFEDAWLVAVDKPPGMATHPLRVEERSTVANELVGRYPEMRGIGFSPLEPGILHRLDRDTSGVLLAARKASAFEQLREQFQQRRVVKIYLAVVHGRPDPQGRIDLPIGSTGRRAARVCVVQDRMSGRPLRTLISAQTSFRLVRSCGPFSLVRLEMKTGARHQLRAHMSHLGHPVAGDPLYGPMGDAIPAGGPVPPRQLLHAAEIRFFHPENGGAMRIRSPLPEDFEAFLGEAELRS